MPLRQFITFYLGDDLFGIDILVVREINRNLDITRIERSPDFVKGMLNLRGQIVTVLDLGSRLGISEREDIQKPSCIVLKTTSELERNGAPQELVESTSNEVVGLFVDRIGDVVDVDSEDVDPPALHGSGVAKRYMEGVVKLQDRLLVTLRTSNILDPDVEPVDV